MWMFARRAILLGLLFAPGGVAQAAPTRHVRVTTYKDFAEGEAHGVLLSSRGEALSGQAATRMQLPSLGDDSVRALASAPDGAVYVGTGGDGPAIQIYEKGALRRLAKLDTSTWVTALCVLPTGAPRGDGGELLAATAHDGRIFQVSRDGKVRVYAKVEADHIWAMVHDRRRGMTYVAAGPGRLWAVDGKSPPRQLFDSGAKQILALTQGDDGILYLGTADDAVLYRVDPTRPGSASTLHDFAGTELRALAYRAGVLYAAVNDMARSESSANRPGVRIVPPPAGTAPGTGGKTSTAERQGKGALYRIDPDGRIEQLHAISDGFFNDVQVSESGVFAGVSTPGSRGRVFWIQPDRTVLTALELKESDVLALNLTGGAGGQFVGTGNSGALYRLGPMGEPPRDAHYLSKVFDAQVLVRWGSLRYAGNGPLSIQTRSGNLAKPDATWSPWQPLSSPSRLPTEEWGGKIASPMGRYLQVRVGFGQRALLHDFTLSYQPTNQRPRVTDIQVGEDALGRIARGPKSTAAKPRQPVVKVLWKVENPDEDELVYRLYIRPVGAAQEWLRLGGQEPLTRTELEWNTESVPDGMYEIRVVASDERANAVGLALTHELISSPFIVDNRRPELRDVAYEPATGVLRGRAVDAVSPLAELAYSVDGGDFFPMPPRDGVLDDSTEEFSVKLPPLSPGSHVVVVKAVDAAENATAARIRVQGR
jgi:hypothetical protein